MKISKKRLESVAGSILCNDHGPGVCGVCDGILAARECLRLRSDCTAVLAQKKVLEKELAAAKAILISFLFETAGSFTLIDVRRKAEAFLEAPHEAK